MGKVERDIPPASRRGPRSSLRAAILLILLPALANAAPPTLSHLFPAGGQRGTTLNVTCEGEFDWPVNVWSPGIEVTPGEEKGVLQVTIPPDIATDRVWLRLYNADGASKVVPFLIGTLPEVNEAEPNNAPSAAQPLEESRVTVNGVLKENGDVDGFSVSLTAGQSLVADVDAHDALGSPMDAILQLLSPDGVVLAENHDDVGLDPRLAVTAPRDGVYTARLFTFPAEPDSTVSFRGNDSYVYRLTLTTGPYISHTIPSVVSLENPGEVEVFGWNIPPETRLPVAPLAEAVLVECGEVENYGDRRVLAGDRIGIVQHPEFAGSSRVRIVPHTVVDGVAAGTVDAPMSLTIPTAVSGRFQAERQTDYYELPLTTNQPLIFTVESRGIELPVQPMVRLIDPMENEASEFDEPKPQDAVITHTTQHEGTYRLTVRDLFRQYGERCVYRLTVRIAEPDFELNLDSDAIVVKPDEPAEVVVNVRRHNTPAGNLGPITIEAIDLPPGVTAEPVVSEVEGDTSEKVTLRLTSTGEASSGPIRIIGRANEPVELERYARAKPQFGTSLSVVWLTAIAPPAVENDTTTEN